MLDKNTKDKIIQKFKTHATDTGSSEVQIAILTEEIRQLTDHLKQHKKDVSSRRGLLKKVMDRRKLLRYLEHESSERFEALVKRLKLKIARIPKEEEPAEKLFVEEAIPEEEVVGGVIPPETVT